MPRAIWNGAVLAESDRTVVVEGNHYFPPETLVQEFFTPSPTRTYCPWKGEASYFHLKVEGKTNSDAAWVYPDPKKAAEHLRGQVAFWRGVRVEN